MQRTPLDAWIGGKIGAGTHWTREELRTWQLIKLNETLSLVRSKSRFYRQHLAGMPESLNMIEEFETFPFTASENLRKHPLDFVCVSQDEISRVVTLQTSGTTANPKRLFFTREDQELTIDFFAVGMSTLVGNGERVMICLPGQTSGSVGDLLQTGLRRIGVLPLLFGSVHDLQRTGDFIRRHEPACIVGSPMQMLGLARRWNPAWPSPKKLLLSTDYLTNAVADTLKTTWQCEHFDHYGSTEMGLGGGVECAAHQGMHMREADMLFEIIDPQSGQVLPPGEEGELVFTTLTRSGMPLIRYRMGDRTEILPGKCACGSEVLRLVNPQGRLSNERLLNGKWVHIKTLDEIFLRIPGVLDAKYDLAGKKAVVKLCMVKEAQPFFIAQAVEQVENRLGVACTVEMMIDPESMVSLAKRRFGSNFEDNNRRQD